MQAMVPVECPPLAPSTPAIKNFAVGRSPGFVQQRCLRVRVALQFHQQAFQRLETWLLVAHITDILDPLCDVEAPRVSEL